VNDLYLKNVRSFNQSLEYQKRQSKESIKQIQKKYKSVDVKANNFKKQLLESLVQLEGFIADNRNKLFKHAALKAQQQKTRREALEKNISNLTRNYSEEVDKLIAKEQQKMKAEEKRLEEYRVSLQKQMEVHSLLMSLQKKSNGSIACYDLDSDSQEFK
jgi:hypothetical protein